MIQLTRQLVQVFGAGLVLLAAQICGADEFFPVVHNEPITIRVLSGRDGHPLTLAHVMLVVGYDQRDMDLRIRRGEAQTDEHGFARLPNTLANFPLLQVSVVKKHLCQSGGRGAIFSIEQIRRDGLSAPNHCGTAMVNDAPGVFTVWVKTGKAPPGPIAPAAVARRSAAPVESVISKPSGGPVSSSAAPKTPGPVAVTDSAMGTPSAPSAGITPAPPTAAAPVCPAVPGPAVAPPSPLVRHRRKQRPPLARA
ncbi:MAG: hypothetical protein WBQ94_12925 [Terracidiphilus sp.]